MTDAIQPQQAQTPSSLPGISVRDYLERLLAEDRARQAEHWAAHGDVHTLEGKAIERAAAAVDLRLVGMNELRAQLNFQAATFATKDMLSASENAMRAALTAVTDARIAAITGAIEKADLANDATNRRVSDLERIRSENQGRDRTYAAVFAFAVVLLSIAASFVMRLVIP